jgi:uncharacterized OB-fold protein
VERLTVSQLEPKATPDTAPFWEAAQEGRLRIQRCNDCGRHYFYPRAFCRYCQSNNVEWVDATGRALLSSYVINNRPLPGTEEASPIIALVTLEEGPQLMTNIVGVEPEPASLPLDLPLMVAFEARGATMVPVFTPESAQ